MNEVKKNLYTKIIGDVIAAIITAISTGLVTNYLTKKDIIEAISVRFDSVDDNMSYQQALEIVYNENKKLKNQNEELIKQNQNLAKKNEDAMNTIGQLHDVTFQNINLIINGIDSGYNDKAIIVNNETFYSQGFLQYIVDNQSISFENSKLFVGNVQTEDQMPVSLFEIAPLLLVIHYLKLQTKKIIMIMFIQKPLKLDQEIGAMRI